MSGRRGATLINAAGMVANIIALAVQTLLLVPQFIRSIGTGLYSAWVSSGDVFQWMIAFDFGLTNVMIQRIGEASAKGDKVTVGRVFFGSSVLIVLLSILVGLIGVFLAVPVAGWLNLSGRDAELFINAFKLSSVATAGVVMNNALIGLGRGCQRTAVLSITSFLSICASIAVTLWLLAASYSIMALAWGLMARTIVLWAGGAMFLLFEAPKDIWPEFRYSSEVMKNLMSVVPASAVGGISYAVINQTEVVIVGALLGKDTALVLFVTRRAMEVIRAMADTVTFSVYGGFAHLVGSDQKSRGLNVYRMLLTGRTALAVSLACVYVTANGAFIALWDSPDRYAGHLITFLIAIQAIVSGTSYFSNYLLRATGDQKRGGFTLALEALARIVCAIVLTKLYGLVGLLLAGIVVSGLCGWIYHRWTEEALQKYSDPTAPLEWAFGAACIVSLAIAALLGSFISAANFFQLAVYLLAALVVFTGVLVAASLRLCQEAQARLRWRRG